MPRINGQVVRARFTALKLSELSAVDNPAQPTALAVCFKRDDDERAEAIALIVKYGAGLMAPVDDDEGAETFADILRENEFDEKIWPYTNALAQSIRSIVGDSSLMGGDMDAAIKESVNGFLAAMTSLSPGTGTQLAKLLSKRNEIMPKTVEQLETEVATLKSELTAAQGEAATAKAKMTAAEEAALAAATEAKTAKDALTAATEEVIKVGEIELKKSEVGEASFAVSKALMDERDMARFEKRADDEYRHVVGKASEKALVLKAVAAMPEEARKAFDAILLSAEKMAAGAFSTLGSTGGRTEVGKAAEASFETKVGEIQKRDGIGRSAAMTKARGEFPTEFEAAYGEGGPVGADA